MRFGDDDGAKTTIWTGGSRTILDFVHAARQRRRTLLIALAVAVAVAGIVTFGVLRYLSAEAAAQVVASYSSLSQCLLGDPLADGEKASMRVRAIQLTALGGGELARASGEPQWPERCASHAHQLHDALAKTSLGDEGGKDLVASAKALGDALGKQGSYFADLTALVDKAFDDARAANLALGPAPGIPAPPARTLPLTVDTIPETARLSTEQLELGSLVVPPFGSNTLRWLATAESRKATPAVCTFREDKAACAPYPGTIAAAAGKGLSMSGTADEDGGALVFAAGGEAGIFRSDNGAAFEVNKATKAIGGYTSVDGYTAVLGLDGDRPALFASDGDRVRKTGVSPGGRRKVAHPERDIQLLWQSVLFVVTGDEDQLSLAAAPLDRKRGLGEVEEIGPLGAEPAKEAAAQTSPRIDGCKTREATIARIRVGRVSYVSFLLGDHWTKPISAGPAGGALSCHGKEAMITQVGSQGGTALTSTITQHVCSPTACQTNTTVMADVLTGEAGLAPSTDLAAAGLAGKVLLVWNAGQRGGVRMRLGTPQTLAKTPDVVLFDGFVKGGALQATDAVATIRVLPAETYAVILLNTTAGVFALRVLPNGTVAPLAISS